ncbi:hypothetical protein HPB51_017009 [Rhipicephalus microplus]|uniref:Secreted protein n=1 Tax=Rhipicephalus microplus TaxID=6941 RepID=A0A9J6F4V8_RHIMP|nr:hypothetical protein HPB51_017009 [Rhipicephalus microplus]
MMQRVYVFFLFFAFILPGASSTRSLRRLPRLECAHERREAGAHNARRFTPQSPPPLKSLASTPTNPDRVAVHPAVANSAPNIETGGDTLLRGCRRKVRGSAVKDEVTEIAGSLRPDVGRAARVVPLVAPRPIIGSAYCVPRAAGSQSRNRRWAVSRRDISVSLVLRGRCQFCCLEQRVLARILDASQ